MHKINITSTVIRVTDPCYDRNTSLDLIGLIGNVMPGEWQCEIFVEGGVPARVQISHLWVRGTRPGPTGFAGVDSGQCGFIDESVMPEEAGEYEDENSFYRKVCNETLENGFIVGENFFFTGTAYGDGTYRWETMTNEENEVVSITLHYIEEDEEEDFDQDEEEEDYDQASDEEEEAFEEMEDDIRQNFEDGEK